MFAIYIQLPRGVRTTAAKRLLEDETVQDNAKKRKKIDDKEVKKAKKL
jgi:hypothetical protein